MTLHRRAIVGGALALSAAGRAAGQTAPSMATPDVSDSRIPGPISTDPAPVEPIALGALYPFSGLLSPFGDESFRGLELAVEARNGAGGLFGRPLKLLKGDAVDPAAGATEAKRLVGTERVAALFGSFSSPLVIAASPVTELAGIPYFELGAIGDPVLERGFRLLFRACSSATMMAALSVDTVGETLARRWGLEREPHRAGLRIAILHEDGLYGSNVGALQLARCKARGLTVVDQLAYSAVTPDLANAVQRFRGAEVTVVLHTGYQSDTVMFYRQLKQANWRPRMVVGCGGGYAMTDTAATIGAEFDGTLNVGFPPYATAPGVAPGLSAVETAYERKYGAKPRSGHSLANYVGATLFLDAMARAGSLDKDKIRAAVLATNVAMDQTANGWGARFDEKGQNTLAFPVVAQWQGAVLRTVLPDDAAVAALKP